MCVIFKVLEKEFQTVSLPKNVLPVSWFQLKYFAPLERPSLFLIISETKISLKIPVWSWNVLHRKSQHFLWIGENRYAAIRL